MNIANIEKIELEYLKIEDHNNIAEMMHHEYRHLDDSAWTHKEFSDIITKFPKGQVGIKIDGEFAGFALSIVVDYTHFEDTH